MRPNEMHCELSNVSSDNVDCSAGLCCRKIYFFGYGKHFSRTGIFVATRVVKKCLSAASLQKRHAECHTRPTTSLATASTLRKDLLGAEETELCGAEGERWSGTRRVGHATISALASARQQFTNGSVSARV